MKYCVSHARAVRKEAHSWKGRKDIPLSKIALQKEYLVSQNTL
jgi:hypothetical protein